MTPSISASFIPEMPFRSGHNRGSALWTVLQVKLCPLRMALFVWFLIALSPGISIKYIPYFTWCATPLLIPLMIRHIRQFKARLAFGPAALLVFVMTLTAIGMNLPMQCAAQAIKAFAILLLLYPFLASAPDYARLGMHTAGFAVILNAILMLLGKVGLTALAQDSGNGRWGTVLNPVGELAFLGLLAFGYGAYGSLHSSKRSWWYVAVCLSAVYNVMTDGSRTGALCLLVLSVYIAYVSVRRGADRARAMRRLACVVVVSICLLMVTPLMGAATGADSNSLVQDRVAKLFKTDSGGIEGSLQTADLARYEVLLMALNAIREHPFWGSGLNSTHIVLDGAVVVVHDAYIQSWADLGLLGCISVTALLLWWVPRLRRLLKLIRVVRTQDHRALYHGAISGLIAYSFICLYHPMSVEISEWLHFIIPSGLCWALLDKGGTTSKFAD